MSVQERLIRYCKIDTQSNGESQTVPTTMKQFDLANVLKDEMIAMGMSHVYLTDQCYLYGEIPSNIEKEVPTIGFIAHMDTAPDFSGTNVQPRLIENYQGETIQLNEEYSLSVDAFPNLLNCLGKDLVVADGTTLLGADDKAGVAEIMEACQYLLSHPEIKHGTVKVGFTPDEEVGKGADHFDVQGFGCDFAYTMDGRAINEVADENFNAASAVVKVQGVSMHPGSAKGKMIHACNVAHEFHGLLPEGARAETTEKKEGFNHLISMTGDVTFSELTYILRNHDSRKLNLQKENFELAKQFLNKKYGRELISVEIKDSYRNMKEILKDNPRAVDLAKEAIQALGKEERMQSARGGTDGARLTFMGLPCPNLGTGGENYHGPHEYCCVQDMEEAVRLILKIVDLATQQ